MIDCMVWAARRLCRLADQSFILFLCDSISTTLSRESMPPNHPVPFLVRRCKKNKNTPAGETVHRPAMEQPAQRKTDSDVTPCLLREIAKTCEVTRRNARLPDQGIEPRTRWLRASCLRPKTPANRQFSETAQHG